MTTNKEQLEKNLGEKLGRIDELYLSNDHLDELEAEIFAALDLALEYGDAQYTSVLMRAMDHTQSRIETRNRLRTQLGPIVRAIITVSLITSMEDLTRGQTDG